MIQSHLDLENLNGHSHWVFLHKFIQKNSILLNKDYKSIYGGKITLIIKLKSELRVIKLHQVNF